MAHNHVGQINGAHYTARNPIKRKDKHKDAQKREEIVSKPRERQPNIKRTDTLTYSAAFADEEQH